MLSSRTWKKTNVYTYYKILLYSSLLLLLLLQLLYERPNRHTLPKTILFLCKNFLHIIFDIISCRRHRRLRQQQQPTNDFNYYTFFVLICKRCTLHIFSTISLSRQNVCIYLYLKNPCHVSGDLKKRLLGATAHAPAKILKNVVEKESWVTWKRAATLTNSPFSLYIYHQRKRKGDIGETKFPILDSSANKPTVIFSQYIYPSSCICVFL